MATCRVLLPSHERSQRYPRYPLCPKPGTILGSAAFERKEGSRITSGPADWLFRLDALSLLVTAPGLRQAVDRERRQRQRV